MFIHDEIIAEVPEDRTHEAGAELARIMCDAMQVVVPDVKITASPAAMRRWYKDATTVYDLNGRLVPWEPRK
jgi:DNA polymerase I-like protein with 3'-5' exonuclease and polymerase domains